MNFDKGQISTVLITLAVIILGVFIAQPALLQQLMGNDLYIQYGAIIIAILVAVFNYINPRTNTPTVEPVKEEDGVA